MCVCVCIHLERNRERWGNKVLKIFRTGSTLRKLNGQYMQLLNSQMTSQYKVKRKTVGL